MTTNTCADSTPELELPGFRFHPTEEELLDFYLKNTILGKIMPFDIITSLNIYHYDPWDLPGKAKLGEREWYFFVPRDRKHGSGGRPNRTTERGFWKATGSDRKIVSLSEPKRVIGLRKTLVFYKGRAPRGVKTDWVMNEYRLPDSCKLSKETVLCKVYRKATSLKVLEQRVAMEEDLRNFQNVSPGWSSQMDTCHSSCGTQEDIMMTPPPPLVQAPPNMVQIQQPQLVLKAEAEELEGMRSEAKESTSLKVPFEYREKLTEIQVPSKLAMEWNTQDPLWMQLNSPWLQSLITPHNILNF